MIKAIYFDLDDTLCGYWNASKAALRTAFSEHAPEGVSHEEMVRHWATAFKKFSPEVKRSGLYEIYLKDGATTRVEQMRRTLKEMGIEDEERAQALSDTYGFHRDKNLTLFHDAIAVLDHFHARFPLGLITNGPADIQRQEIATLGIGHYFQNFFIEGEMGFGKPEPEVFRMAASAVGMEPSELLMVGNSYGHDIKPAIEAGWSTAWIVKPSDVPPSATTPEEKPEDHPEPTRTISELTELFEMV